MIKRIKLKQVHVFKSQKLSRPFSSLSLNPTATYIAVNMKMKRTSSRLQADFKQTSNGLQVDFMCTSGVLQVDFKWTSSGLQVDFKWTSFWISCSQWFAQRHFRVPWQYAVYNGNVRIILWTNCYEVKSSNF